MRNVAAWLVSKRTGGIRAMSKYLDAFEAYRALSKQRGLAQQSPQRRAGRVKIGSYAHKIDDARAPDILRCLQAMFWPYSKDSKLIGEDGYRRAPFTLIKPGVAKANCKAA
jgi:hypothetical protein